MHKKYNGEFAYALGIYNEMHEKRRVNSLQDNLPMKSFVTIKLLCNGEHQFGVHGAPRGPSFLLLEFHFRIHDRRSWRVGLLFFFAKSF